MAKYVNIENTTNELLKIEFIPKTQASKVNFKGAPPLNYHVAENGTVSFSLATKLIDRTSFCIRGTPLNMLIWRINGVDRQNPLYLSVADMRPDMLMLNSFDLAQLGIGTVITYTNTIVENSIELAPTLLMYNTLPIVNTLEGDVTDGAGNPASVLRNRSRAFFNDQDLEGAGLIVDKIDGGFGIALGTNNKAAGTEVVYGAPLLDPDNSLTTGDVYLAVTVSEPGKDDVKVEITVPLTRDSNETTWYDAVDSETLTNLVVDKLNEEYGVITESDEIIFGKALNNQYFGAPFLVYVGKDPIGIPNLFLPTMFIESIDGTWAMPGGSMEGPMAEPMAMAFSGDGSMDGSMGGSMDSSMGGSMTPVVPNPYENTALVIYVTISGTPLVDLNSIDATLNNENVDSRPPMPVEDYEDAMNMMYELRNRTLTVHTANPESGEPMLHLGHSANTTPLEIYGEDLADFKVLSAGTLKQSLWELSGPPPMGSMEELK